MLRDRVKVNEKIFWGETDIMFGYDGFLSSPTVNIVMAMAREDYLSSRCSPST